MSIRSDTPNAATVRGDLTTINSSMRATNSFRISPNTLNGSIGLPSIWESNSARTNCVLPSCSVAHAGILLIPNACEQHPEQNRAPKQWCALTIRKHTGTTRYRFTGLYVNLHPNWLFYGSAASNRKSLLAVLSIEGNRLPNPESGFTKSGSINPR